MAIQVATKQINVQMGTGKDTYLTVNVSSLY